MNLLQKLRGNYYIVKMSALVSTTIKHVNICPSSFFFFEEPAK